MIKEVKLYQCGYCGDLCATEEDAITCINNHGIVFQVKKLTRDHDCWGKATYDWELTGKTFKQYEDAKEYIQKQKYPEEYKIAYLELD